MPAIFCRKAKPRTKKELLIWPVAIDFYIGLEYDDFYRGFFRHSEKNIRKGRYHVEGEI